MSGESINVLARLQTTEDMFAALTGEPLTSLPIRDVRAAVEDLLTASRRVTSAFRAMGESRSMVASITNLRAECEASMVALDAAIARATGADA